jgi:hypothetical protein
LAILENAQLRPADSRGRLSPHSHNPRLVTAFSTQSKVNDL